MIDLAWRDIAPLLGVVTGIAGVGYAVLRARMIGDFATAADVRALEERISELETTVRRVPSHDDIRQIGVRVGELERTTAVVSTEVRGVKDILGRVEQMTDLLVRHQLQGEKRA